MEKEIEFDAQVDLEDLEYAKSKLDGNERYVLINFFHKDAKGLKPSKAQYHVTLSPACPERSPDYKAMWVALKAHHVPAAFPTTEMFEGKILSAKQVHDFMVYLEDSHTPQGNQTGVKKEKT